MNLIHKNSSAIQKNRSNYHFPLHQHHRRLLRRHQMPFQKYFAANKIRNMRIGTFKSTFLFYLFVHGEQKVRRQAKAQCSCFLQRQPDYIKNLSVRWAVEQSSTDKGRWRARWHNYCNNYALEVFAQLNFPHITLADANHAALAYKNRMRRKLKDTEENRRWWHDCLVSWECDAFGQTTTR